MKIGILRYGISFDFSSVFPYYSHAQLILHSFGKKRNICNKCIYTAIRHFASQNSVVCVCTIFGSSLLLFSHPFSARSGIHTHKMGTYQSEWMNEVKKIKKKDVYLHIYNCDIKIVMLEEERMRGRGGRLRMQQWNCSRTGLWMKFSALNWKRPCLYLYIWC